MKSSVLNIGEVMRPYTLAGKIKIPTVPLPIEARDRLKSEVESIKRCYRQPVLRAQALDMVIDRIREEFPGSFQVDK